MIKDLHSKWKLTILKLAKEGASEVELRAALGGICHETWSRLIEEEPEFSETVKQCRTLSEAWWIRFGREHLLTDSGQKLNEKTYFLHLKNRFRWSEKEPDKGAVNEGPTILEVLVPAGEYERVKQIEGTGER